METTINDVYEVFKDYYGEERVDLQNNDIIVHFPRVTVTNENDQSVEITDLYVKTSVTFDGYMDGVFTMTRGSYVLSQVRYNYLHSHVLDIPHENNTFARCCTGSGPIVRTMSLLATDSDLDRWRLYCYELDKYTQVESKTGVPYHYLERISKSTFKNNEITLQYDKIFTVGFKFDSNIVKNFVQYLINNEVIKFSKHGNHYFIAHSFIEYLSILTTAFMEFDGKNNVNYYINKNILIKGTYENGVFKTKQCNDLDNFYNPEGNIACRFKGHDVIVTVTNDLISEDDSRDIIINPKIANYLLYKILAVLNYGNAKRQQDEVATEEGRAIII